ncbi:DUF11 domain-containing protein [Microbulbifer litoralis]|uniref:DUF11 domain-containing protein n=1 Tax=Microbulbifer litoralis TaxID=2933965 RepID=UPI00202913F2|nr:DUF11 domain-containing protein [Microbulbifer sp. GX H0434]
MNKDEQIKLAKTGCRSVSVFLGAFVVLLTIPLTALGQGTADLLVTKEALPDTVSVGTQFDYVFEFINYGPDDADEFSLVDELPSSLNYVSCVAPTAFSCGMGGAGVFKAEVASLPTDLWHEVVLTVEVAASAVPNSQISNTVVVSSQQDDPFPPSNDFTESVFVEDEGLEADLAITKEASADTVIVGTQFDYTLTIENAGPDNAEQVELVDMLPAELTYVSCSTGGAPGSSCELLADGETFTAALGTIDSGASRDVTLTVELDESTPVGTEVVNGANVQSPDADDPDKKNNIDSASVIAAAAPEPLTYYLHGFDVAGTANGFTMDMNAPSPPQPLNLNLINAPKWYSDPALDGSFAAGDYELSFPCSLGIGVATTYALHRTDIDGSNPELMASLTQPLQVCTGFQTITIPVRSVEALDDERLRLRISTLLGLSLTLDLGEDVKLVTPEFTEASGGDF